MSGEDFLLASKLGQIAEVKHYVSNNEDNINYQNEVIYYLQKSPKLYDGTN